MDTGLALRTAVLRFQEQAADTLAPAATPTFEVRAWFEAHPVVETAVWLVGVLVLAWLSHILAKRYFLRAVSKVVARTRFTWDDAIQKQRVFDRLAVVAPAVVIYYCAGLIPGLPAPISEIAQRVAVALMVLVFVLSTDRLLTAVNDIYSKRPGAKSRPIKGYFQIIKMVLYIVAGIVVISLLVNRSPAVFLGGVGALTAVILLVFRDTILSLVASIQLTQNDMIAVGDWIEMPKYGADGDVIDIALHTIKVQNWDKTITTIPTHKFIEDSFKNWRGMSLSGGRRIKRAFYLDLNSVGFLSEGDIERLGRFELLRDYIREKREELEEYNASREASDPDVIPNSRRLTNAGTLRAYIVNYLRQHPKLHREMTLIVRQLQSGPQGLPIEVYVFSSDIDWVNYEGIQSDIFDHIFAMIPEFGLRIFQSPSGSDIERLGGRITQSGTERLR